MIRILRSLIFPGLLMIAACSFAEVVTAKTHLQGAGATFPAPLYRRLVVVYQGLHPDVLIDYQSIGSGGGIKAITDRTVHFCASDAPLGKKELAAVGGADHIVEIPICAGGIVPIFNVPGIVDSLNFSGELLANIYLGNVSIWNDPAIVKLNPNVALPDLVITPVWRTDGSGTSFIFTSYLTTQSDEFAFTVGMGKQVQWPFGQGGKGNEGVTAVVQQTAGSLGYVEQSYAVHNQLLSGLLRNKSGKFVGATAASVSEAGAGADFGTGDTLLAAEIWNRPGDGAYPIASFTYLIVYKDLRNLPDVEAAQNLASFLWWATHDGQRYATELGYAPLAPAVQQKVAAALKALNYRGTRLHIGE